MPTEAAISALAGCNPVRASRALSCRARLCCSVAAIIAALPVTTPRPVQAETITTDLTANLNVAGGEEVTIAETISGNAHTITTEADTGSGVGALTLDDNVGVTQVGVFTNNGATTFGSGASMISSNVINNQWLTLGDNAVLYVKKQLSWQSAAIKNNYNIYMGNGATLQADGFIYNEEGATIETHGNAVFNAIANDAWAATFINKGKIWTDPGYFTITIGTETPSYELNYFENHSTGTVDLRAGVVMQGENTVFKNAGKIFIFEDAALSTKTFENQSGGYVLLDVGGTLYSSVQNKAGAEIDINNGTLSGKLVNAGTVTNTGNLDDVENTGGTIDNQNIINGDLVISGGVVTNSGTVEGQTTLSGGKLETSGQVQDVTFTRNSELEVTSGAVGNVTIDGSLSPNTGGTLTMTGGSIQDLDVTGDYGKAILSAGQVDGDTTIGFGATVEAAGAAFNGAVTVAEAVVKPNEPDGPGTFVLSADTTVTGKFINNGKVMSTGTGPVTLTIASGYDFVNYGTLDGDSENGTADMTITADNIYISPESIVTGNVFLNGTVDNGGVQDITNDLSNDLVVLAGGISAVKADISGNGHNVTTNAAGGISDQPGVLRVNGVTFDDIATLHNKGETYIRPDATLSAQVIDNSGLISLDEGASLIGTGNTMTNEGAIVAEGSALIADAGAINNSGTLTFKNGGTLNPNSDNSGGEAFNNSGTLSIGGNQLVVFGDGTADVINNLAEGEIVIETGVDYSNTHSALSGQGTTLNNAGKVSTNVQTSLDLAAINNLAGGVLWFGENASSDERRDVTTVTVTNGIVNAAGATLTSVYADLTADVENHGTLNANFTGNLVSDGDIISATVLGDTQITGGTAQELLTFGDLTVENAVIEGRVINHGASLDASTTTNNGGTIIVTAGSLSNIVNNSGRFDITGNTVETHSVHENLSFENHGTASNASTRLGKVSVTNTGTFSNSGTLKSFTGNSGTFENSGTVENVVINDGSATNTGSISTFRQYAGVSLSSGSIDSYGLFGTASGTISGTVREGIGAQDSAALLINGNLTLGQFSNRPSTITNNSVAPFRITAGVTSLYRGGTVTNFGDMRISDASLIAYGTNEFLNKPAASLSLTNARLDSQTFWNADGASATFTDSAFNGWFSNNGTLSLFGTNTWTGDLVSPAAPAATAVVTMQNGVTTDHLSVSGNLQLGRRLELDVDLSDSTGKVDTISVSGAVTKTEQDLTFAFNNVGPTGTFVAFDSNVDVLTYGSFDVADYAVTGLPTTGAVQYKLVNNTSANALQLQNATNPGTGGVVGGVGAVGGINNPGNQPGTPTILPGGSVSQVLNSVPRQFTPAALPGGGTFARTPTGGAPSAGLSGGLSGGVSGGGSGGLSGGDNSGTLNFLPGEPVLPPQTQTNTWARVNGGRATMTSETTTSLGTTSSDVDVRYQGVDTGFDISGGESPLLGDWSFSLGASLGTTTGNVSQPVFNLDGATGNVIPGSISSYNRQDFTQVQGGVTFGLTRGDVFADLRLGYASTRSDLKNLATDPTSGLGIADQTYTTQGPTFSGKIGKTFLLDEVREISLTPSLGFFFSNQSADDLTYDNGTPNDTSDDGLLQIDDVQTRLAHLGVTLAKETMLQTGTAAIQYFGTITGYKDFGRDTTSHYFQKTDGAGNPDPSVAPLESRSSASGAYGELSLGLTYIQTFDTGLASPVKKLEATLRADSQIAGSVDGWGLTAQIRYSF
ncbi:hypothetical protein E0K93_04310 [Puniceibacterium sp. HSS470]|uniref:beta strand repeat-containing protein n=1 Tax=Pseudooceanicola sediminis TaxID=2211117 RepID=UPI000E6691D1|nr:hypothetical protein [Pseudooceanicola sediminis]KAA2316083.1 hypothetical protein E0K93_04310 [Puniceibacterium sp. HSS470]|tara:strand:+ start:2172 stop:7358 length:5187 start_codon:yes stop_codon:yes gene_type:complete